MLVIGLLNSVLHFFEFLTGSLSLPGFSESILNVCSSMISYVLTGCDILACFIGNTAAGIMAVCFDLIITFWVFGLGWTLTWFIIRKIPMVNIRE